MTFKFSDSLGNRFKIEAKDIKEAKDKAKKQSKAKTVYLLN